MSLALIRVASQGPSRKRSTRLVSGRRTDSSVCKAKQRLKGIVEDRFVCYDSKFLGNGDSWLRGQII